jgi:thiol peroxidase
VEVDMERRGIITFQGNGLTLLGPDLKVGDRAPDFNAVDKDMKPVKLSDFKGEIVVISAVPSLDTHVCELQTTRFNQEASALNARVLTISMDLPFAQSRFCDAFNIKNLILISDYKDREFSNSYGLYIKEIGLIARSIFIIDKDGKIAYREIVNEITTHPDYDRAIAEAKKLGA